MTYSCRCFCISDKKLIGYYVYYLLHIEIWTLNFPRVYILYATYWNNILRGFAFAWNDREFANQPSLNPLLYLTNTHTPVVVGAQANRNTNNNRSMMTVCTNCRDNIIHVIGAANEFHVSQAQPHFETFHTIVLSRATTFASGISCNITLYLLIRIL